MNRAPHWLRARMGVRVVSALAAAAAVAVVLVVAGVSLVLLLDHQLRQSTESAAVSQAEVLGQRIAGNFTGSGDAKENSIDATGKRGDIVQVLTDYGDDSDDPDSRVGSNGPQSDVQVIGSSDTLDSQPRLVPWLLAPRETRVVPSTEIRLADGSTEEVTIVGKGVRATGRPITVLAAQPLKPVHQAVDTVSVMVSVGIPILVLITGFFTYLFAGRALRPVEAMRRRVAGLTDRDLDRRVPEPHTQDEVGRLARTMNQMLSRLQDSQATQRRFVADASHELRSPLATVSTGLELLGNGMGKDSADLATVQTLRGETGRLTKLVEGLLFLARADERGLAPRREEVDLDELVEGERVRPSADDSVSVTVSTEPVRVVGDRSQLVRVLRNLVDNARRHAGSTVAVSVRADGDLAVIDVDDDGCGVPEADRTRVFERFVRLDEARARGDGGSGLGLAIVAELVAAHGGTVSAGESETLGGARFRVTVPLSGSPGSLEVAEPTPAAGAGTDEPWTVPDTDRAADVSEHAWAPAALSAAGAATPAVATAEDRNGSDLFSPMVSAGTGDSTTAGPAPATPVSAGSASATSAWAGSASATPASTTSGHVTSSTSAWSAFREPEAGSTKAGSPSTPSDTTAGAGTGSGTDVPAPTAADAEPVLFDDRPSGPLPRVPMGGRRRRPVEATSPTAGKPTAGDGTAGDGTAGTSTRPDEVVARSDEASGATPAEAGADTPAVPPANGTPRAPRTTPPPPSTSQPPAPSTQQPSTQQPPVPGPPAPRSPISDPPTGPLPIRPNTVGSPADENATRPLPVVRSTGGGRAGTAVAPARRDAGTDGVTRNGGIDGVTRNGGIDGVTRNGGIDGVTRNGGTDGATRNGGTNGTARSGTAPNGVTRNGTPPRGLPSRYGGANGVTAPYGRNGAGSNGHGSNGHGSNGHGSNGHGADGHGLPDGNGFRRPNGRPQDPQDGPGRNGHPTNGHPTNGHPQNGRARSDRPQNGHPRNGTDGAGPRRDDTPES